MKNPIPHSNLFASPTLEQIQTQIESLPADQKQVAYMVFTMTMNACFELVDKELDKTTV